MSEPAPPRRPRAYHLLAALPALCMLGGVPWANRVEPFVLGLPFLLFWILRWVVVTSGVMGLSYALDQAAARAAESSGGGAGGVARPGRGEEGAP